MIKATGKIKLNPVSKILNDHKLGKNGEAQKFFTHEVRRLSDPFVPLDTGFLKNNVTEKPTELVYVAPYAKTNWLRNKGNGDRGAKWTERMLNARKRELVENTAKFIGGKPG